MTNIDTTRGLVTSLPISTEHVVATGIGYQAHSVGPLACGDLQMVLNHLPVGRLAPIEVTGTGADGQPWRGVLDAVSVDHPHGRADGHTGVLRLHVTTTDTNDQLDGDHGSRP